MSTTLYLGCVPEEVARRPIIVLLCDVVATVIGQTLDILSSKRHRRIPGRSPIKASACYKQNIAVLDTGNDYDPALWLYNHLSDLWTSIDIPNWHGSLYPGHSLTLDPDLYVFSPLNAPREQKLRTMEVWSPTRQFTTQYIIDNQKYHRGFSVTNRVTRCGNKHRIANVRDLFISLDGQTEVFDGPTACFYDAFFTTTEHGILTNRGLLRADWTPDPWNTGNWRTAIGKRPIELLVNEHYLISLHRKGQGMVPAIYVFYLRAQGKTLKNFIWEGNDNDE